MDKALVEEFNKRYFGKNQLKRRIYDENELEIIWKNINVDRRKKSIDIGIKLNDENSLWYNITEDVKLIIDYINDIKKSEITKYLIDTKAIDKNKKVRNTDYRELGDQFKNILDFIEKDTKSDVIIKSAILNFYIFHLNSIGNNNLEMAVNITNSYFMDNGYEIIAYSGWLDLIKEDERRYVNVIENTLINEGDLTYFIKYYVAIIQNSIKKLINGFSVKHGKKIIKELLDNNNVYLEERQLKLINSMVTLSNNKISIDDYRKKTKVSYETARSDLNELVTLGFFKINKCGKKYEFYFNDIGTIMEDFNEINIKI